MKYEELVKNVENEATATADAFTSKAVYSPNGLEKGDVLEFPKKYTVYKTMFGKYPVESMVVPCTTAEGVKTGRRIYPSMFCRQSQVVDKDGHSQFRVAKCTGDVAAVFYETMDMATAMDSLKGKSVEITNISHELTHVPNGEMADVRETAFYEVNFKK